MALAPSHQHRQTPAVTRRQTVLTLASLFTAGGSGILSGCASAQAQPGPPEGRHATTNLSGLDSAQLYRLVNRLSWGASDSELNVARQFGPSAYIEQQTRDTPPAVLPAIAQGQIDALSIAQKPLLTILSELEDLRLADDKQPYQKELTRLAREAATRHVLRALYSPQQLREHMVWFWFNHFNVHQHKHNIRAMLGDYEDQALRTHALGRFRDLLGAVAHHPAMLRYLDNDQNAVDRVNENYARELLELHTLGVDAGYSQRDVQELARVLTGHGVRHLDKTPKLKRQWADLYVRQGAYEFNPARHDFGDKSVLGMSIRGQGAAELDQVLDKLASHPATARFVCGKLARFMLSDTPPDALVKRMSATFLSTQGHIGETLKTLLSAPEFTQAEPGKFKDPMHYVLSAIRAAYDDKIILNAAPVLNWLNRLGEGLYNRQTPDGYPLTQDAWSSSGQMAVRFEIARAIGTHSAGLFKTEDGQRAEQPGFPQLARASYYQFTRALMRPDTLQALDNTASPQDWNTLYLSAPEFMYR